MAQPNRRVGRQASLRRRLLISSLLGAVPLIVLGVVLLLIGYQSRRNQILHSNLTAAQLAAAGVQGWVDGHVDLLRTLVISDEIQFGAPGEKRSFFKRQLRVHPEWENLFLTDATGRVTVHSLEVDPLPTIADRDYFHQVRQTRQPAVSNLLIGRVSGHRVVIVAFPLSQNGRFTGVLAATTRPRELQQLLPHPSSNEQFFFAVWGSDRRIIARTNTVENQLGQQYPAGPFFDTILAGKSGTLITTPPMTHAPTLIGYAPVAGTSWTVLVGTPVSMALGSLYRTTALYLVAAALVLLTTLLWSLYSAQIVTRQVAALADSARAIGQGKLGTRVELSAGGELEDLANSLNKMAANLEMIDRLKADLLGMMSHELKTPLTTIRTSLEVIAEGMVTPEQPKYQELLITADRQARRLQDLIENLLSIAKLEAGAGLGITQRPMSLVSMLKSSVTQYRGLAEAHGLTFTVEMPPDVRVMADAQKVKLALNNLLDNAVKFTEQGEIILRAVVEEQQVVITVTDTGVGLTPEVRERLFTRFYQAEPLLTRRVPGAGLGLAVTRAIIETQGGRVFAESEGPGKGSTFGFTLPLAE
ncbi:MAG: sensor histidine kinase [Armatimonadota bacterium]